ncbi:hypothetical protein GGR56DRAFT_664237 [Xylariaceae sp. FL0804]|nr:hypothetical protein GGR56DRAFT_664237 [Xylariaceae sp. FL0804]
MRYSSLIQSSPNCLPSPDGRLIATLLPSRIAIRAVDALGAVRAVKLPPELSASVTNFAWSPTSARVLVSVTDQLHVFSAIGDGFHATASIPFSLGPKSMYVDFGATDLEVCVWSPLGIKLILVNLASSRAVEISNPKFYHAASAARGCSFRSGTCHLALLTRTAGKDMISIHSPGTREVERSWAPDTIDAQALAWTPDGRWLVVWDSPAYGPRVILYTSDGHVFKDWRGSVVQDLELQYAGVRALEFSPNGRHAAVADDSSSLCMLHGQTLAEEMRLRHPTTVRPRDTLQVWQEQAGALSFVKAVQAVTPPGASSSNAPEMAKSGCNLVRFDSSSNLLATRLEGAPTTIWIWDVPTSELRAVLMYHAPVSRVQWHPVQPELLLVRCDGDDYAGLVFIWDPLSEGPRPIEFARRLPGGKVSGRTHVTWLKAAAEAAVVFYADHSNCGLISLADADEALPWQEHSSSDQLEDSMVDDPNDSGTDLDEGVSELEDTFHFKKSPFP